MRVDVRRFEVGGILFHTLMRDLRFEIGLRYGSPIWARMRVRLLGALEFVGIWSWELKDCVLTE